MENDKKQLLICAFLAAVVFGVPPEFAMAQTFKSLYSFSINSGYPQYTNIDGLQPYNSVIVSGNTLYGTTDRGGTNGAGTVFSLSTYGTGFKALHYFSAYTVDNNYNYFNVDGANPLCGLILVGNTLYGTTQNAGPNGSGTVFAVNTDGSGFTVLYAFSITDNQGINPDGASPEAALLLVGDTLYGRTDNGGLNGLGTIFSIKTNGTSFNPLHSFSFSGIGSYGFIGGHGGLVSSGTKLYGTESGDSINNGVIFAMNTDGSGFTNVHTFSGITPNHNPSFSVTNWDGAYPLSDLILSSNLLYGTTESGGIYGNGVIFAIKTDGSGFTNLFSFSQGVGQYDITNSDGAEPYNGLLLSGNTLYGTASSGGTNGSGTLFAINTDGTSFKNLHAFNGTDGKSPMGKLFLSGNTLYGTTENGGSNYSGTVFSLTLASPASPQLESTRFGANLILTWPTNAGSFTLEFSTNLIPPVFWNTNLPAPVVSGSQYFVTNPITSPQKYFRLISN